MSGGFTTVYRQDRGIAHGILPPVVGLSFGAACTVEDTFLPAAVWLRFGAACTVDEKSLPAVVWLHFGAACAVVETSPYHV